MGAVVVNCCSLILYPLCSVLAQTPARADRVRVRTEARQCVGEVFLVACIFICVDH